MCLVIGEEGFEVVPWSPTEPASSLWTVADACLPGRSACPSDESACLPGLMKQLIYLMRPMQCKLVIRLHWKCNYHSWLTLETNCCFSDFLINTGSFGYYSLASTNSSCPACLK